MYIPIKPENVYILHGFVKFQKLHPQVTHVLLNNGYAIVAYIIQSRNLFADNTYGDFFNRYYVHTDIVGLTTVSEALKELFIENNEKVIRMEFHRNKDKKNMNREFTNGVAAI
ncbi:MAG: hypothetical protein EZS28_051159, partial [Streblomastix strix]